MIPTQGGPGSSLNSQNNLSLLRFGAVVGRVNLPFQVYCAWNSGLYCVSKNHLGIQKENESGIKVGPGPGCVRIIVG